MTPAASREYDRIAWLYDRHWHERFADAAARCVLRLLDESPAPGAGLLDVCCGAGHVSARLARHGFHITGVDGSARLLDCAARRLPQATWLQADVTEWLPPGPFDAAMCTFDSVNHVLDPERVQALFQLVRRSLRPGAAFVFDFNTPKAYEREWHKSSFTIEADHVMIVRGAWDRENGIGQTDITAFLRNGEAWQRIEAHLAQRSYTREELLPRLVAAGFLTPRFVPAAAVGMDGDIGTGRMFVKARRSAGPHSSVAASQP